MSGCPFCHKHVERIDWKDVSLLRLGLERDGTIARRRLVCRRHQRQLAVAVKRARLMALLPAGPPAKKIEWPPREKRRRRRDA